MKVTSTCLVLMAHSDTEETYETPQLGASSSHQHIGGEVDDEVLDKPNNRTIHSGHFMVSHVHDDDKTSNRGNIDIIDPNNQSQTRSMVSAARTRQPDERAVKSQIERWKKCEREKNLEIDTSLTKLFKCMTLAYSGKLTSPKWKNFRGVKVMLKDKIRLNNIIWREWFMQYIKGRRPVVCQFEPPTAVLNQTNPEVLRLEGKTWKLRLDSVTNDYKKWCRFFKEKFSQKLDDGNKTSLSRDIEINALVGIPPASRQLAATVTSVTTTASTATAPAVGGGLTPLFQELMDSSDVLTDDDFFLDVSDTLFSSLTNFNGGSSGDQYQRGIHQAAAVGGGYPGMEDIMDTLDQNSPSNMKLVDFKGFGRLSSMSGLSTSNQYQRTQSTNQNQISRNATMGLPRRNNAYPSNNSLEGLSDLSGTNSNALSQFYFDLPVTGGVSGFDEQMGEPASIEYNQTHSGDGASRRVSFIGGHCVDQSDLQDFEASNYPTNDYQLLDLLFDQQQDLRSQSPMSHLPTIEENSESREMDRVPGMISGDPGLDPGLNTDRVPNLIPELERLIYRSSDISQANSIYGGINTGISKSATLEKPFTSQSSLTENRSQANSTGNQATLRGRNNSDNSVPCNLDSQLLRLLEAFAESSPVPEETGVNLGGVNRTSQGYLCASTGSLNVKQEGFDIPKQRSQIEGRTKTVTFGGITLPSSSNTGPLSSLPRDKTCDLGRQTVTFGLNNMPSNSGSILTGGFAQRSKTLQSNLGRSMDSGFTLNVQSSNEVVGGNVPPLTLGVTQRGNSSLGDLGRPMDNNFVGNAMSGNEVVRGSTGGIFSSIGSSRGESMEEDGGGIRRASTGSLHGKQEGWKLLQQLQQLHRQQQQQQQQHRLSQVRSQSLQNVFLKPPEPTGTFYQWQQQQQQTGKTKQSSLLETLLTRAASPIKSSSFPEVINFHSPDGASGPSKRRRMRHKSDQTATQRRYSTVDHSRLQHLQHPVKLLPKSPPTSTCYNDAIGGASAVFQPINPLSTVATPSCRATATDQMSTVTSGGLRRQVQFHETSFNKPIAAVPAQSGSGSMLADNSCISSSTNSGSDFQKMLQLAAQQPIRMVDSSPPSCILTGDGSQLVEISSDSSNISGALSSNGLLDIGTFMQPSCLPQQRSRHASSESAGSYFCGEFRGGGVGGVAGGSGRRKREIDEREIEINKELRRVSHITAEKKRRGSIKSGFDTLNQMMPGFTNNPCVKISKSATLFKAADLCRKMKQEREQKIEEVDALRRKVKSLEYEINACHSQLPAAGMPGSSPQTSLIQQMFDNYLSSRMEQNWKFWIFSLIIQKLFDTYNSTVQTSGERQFSRTVLDWLNTQCSLVELRPIVLSAIRQLSTRTSILTEPSALADQAIRESAKNRNMALHHR